MYVCMYLCMYTYVYVCVHVRARAHVTIHQGCARASVCTGYLFVWSVYITEADLGRKL